MIKIWTPPGTGLSVSAITSRFDPDEIIEEMDRALAAGDQRPGQDRLTVISPQISPEEMTLDALMRIHMRSVRVARLALVQTVRRSVFVTQDGHHSRGAKVYIEMRRSLPGPVPDLSLVHDIASASVVLGLADLSPHFRQWPELGVYLTRQ
jgi:hypothetical protein